MLVRGSSLSYDLYSVAKQIFRGAAEESQSSLRQTIQNFLFDLEVSISESDARLFIRKMNWNSPREIMTAAPIHMAYSGVCVCGVWCVVCGVCVCVFVSVCCISGCSCICLTRIWIYATG